MNIAVPNDAEITSEALEVLIKHLPPSKVAKLVAAWRMGSKDYLQTRDEMFANETVDSLFKKMEDKAKENARSLQ